MKLNLGCGPKHLPGFTNVDFESNWTKTPPDLACDLTKPLPFDDGVADEIHAYHVFEHFYRYDADRILDDWVRVLKPGGKLVLEMPCFDKVLAIINHCIANGKGLPPNMTMWALYGDGSHHDPAMIHRWCYPLSEIANMFENRGLDFEFEEPQTHMPMRDMRIVGVK